MKLVAYYSVYNEGDFIAESLASVCPHVDRTIIIEGAWRETYEVNGNKNSTDDTVEKIQLFCGENPQYDIELHHHSENDQIAQRNALWQYLKDDCILFLVDGDEVWSEDQILKLKELLPDWPKGKSAALPPFCYTVDSLTFVNDLYTYTPIRFPRLWELEKGLEYRFVEPNRIVLTNEFTNIVDADFHVENLDVYYFHYSYCHSPERFQEKKKERTKKHGQFSWELRDGLVQKDGVQYTEFTGKHPEPMIGHKLMGVRKHRDVKRPETIVYIEHSGIGNLILATPMLQALRRAKPDAHIHVVSWSRAFRVLEGAPYLDSVIAADQGNQLAQLANIPIDHLLVSPVGALDQVVQWLGQWTKQTHRLDTPTPWTIHEADRKMVFAKKLGYRDRIPPCSVEFFGYNYANAYDALFTSSAFDAFRSHRKAIAINAAYLKSEHWPLKHWGNANYSQLVRELQMWWPDLAIVFVGSSADKQDAQEIINNSLDQTKCLNLCGFSNDIKDTLAVLSNGVDLCVGNDGGLQHAADAVGTDTVTIFTFTNPVKNRPYNQGKILMVPCENRLSCQHGNWQRCKANGCLDLSVSEVFETIKERLNNG